eukprot:scaffold787_cov285-Chaetoceros_neogracile.AAC.66
MKFSTNHLALLFVGSASAFAPTNVNVVGTSVQSYKKDKLEPFLFEVSVSRTEYERRIPLSLMENKD